MSRAQVCQVPSPNYGNRFLVRLSIVFVARTGYNRLGC
jgi:hypothetical protein